MSFHGAFTRETQEVTEANTTDFALTNERATRTEANTTWIRKLIHTCAGFVEKTIESLSKFSMVDLNVYTKNVDDALTEWTLEYTGNYPRNIAMSAPRYGAKLLHQL